jgi:protein-L-isoaspartate(D-aspartate) O-methyltransferase
MMDERSEERRRMVEQFVSRGLRNEAVLAAMRTVPREAFIAAELAEFAYEDAPLPIDAGQTISQPYIVAAMTAALELAPRDRALEVGTGSGYAAAVLSRIADEVYTIEPKSTDGVSHRMSIQRNGLKGSARRQLRTLRLTRSLCSTSVSIASSITASSSTPAICAMVGGGSRVERVGSGVPGPCTPMAMIGRPPS